MHDLIAAIAKHSANHHVKDEAHQEPGLALGNVGNKNTGVKVLFMQNRTDAAGDAWKRLVFAVAQQTFLPAPPHRTDDPGNFNPLNIIGLSLRRCRRKGIIRAWCKQVAGKGYLLKYSLSSLPHHASSNRPSQ